MTRRRIPALPSARATATAGALAATQPQGSRERPSRCVRGDGGGGGPTSPTARTLGSETPPGLGPLLSGILASPGEPRLGAGSGELGFPGPEAIPPTWGGELTQHGLL